LSDSKLADVTRPEQKLDAPFIAFAPSHTTLRLFVSAIIQSEAIGQRLQTTNFKARAVFRNILDQACRDLFTEQGKDFSVSVPIDTPVFATIYAHLTIQSVGRDPISPNLPELWISFPY